MSECQVQVRQERFYSAHHTLLRIASDALQRTSAPAMGWRDNCFIVVAFSAFATEPFCNAVCKRLFPSSSKIVNASPRKKLALICKHLGLNFDTSLEPWKSIDWLCGIRNTIAHSKAEAIDEKTIEQTWLLANLKHYAQPLSDLEKELDTAAATRALKAIMDVIAEICGHLSDEQRSGISTDGWTTAAGEIIDQSSQAS